MGRRVVRRRRTSKIAYSVAELAEVLGVSDSLLYRLIEEGELPHVRLGERRILVPKNKLDEFLSSRADESLSASAVTPPVGACPPAPPAGGVSGAAGESMPEIPLPSAVDLPCVGGLLSPRPTP